MSSRKSKKNIAILIVIVVAVVLVGVAATRNKGPKEIKSPVRTAKAEVADIQQKVTEVGNVTPEVKVDVKSAVSGKVTTIYHREGDAVKRGDVLARVEPDLNQAQSLSETKNSLHSTELAYEEAKKNYEADHQLFTQGLLATKQHRDSEGEYLRARQNYDGAREKYAIVEQNGIPIGQAGRGFQDITAPMDGLILTKNIEIGETVTSGVSSFNAGTVMFSVADVSSMIVKAGVNEVDIGKIHVDQPVKVTLDAYPKVAFNGKISRIAPAVRIDDKVRVFDVEVRLDAQGKELRSGMTANIDVIGEKKMKVLTVPVESVFQRDDGDVVYVLKKVDPNAKQSDDGKGEGKDGKPGDKDAWKKFFDKRVIVTGLADNARVEVISGLKAGEEVALEDPTLPKDKNNEED
jgi:HlyD family secretion protein